MKFNHAVSVFISAHIYYLLIALGKGKGKWMDCKRDWKTNHSKKVNFEVIK